jgi:hypothetical protein
MSATNCVRIDCAKGLIATLEKASPVNGSKN